MGFCVTERGGGFAWAENSHFFRLTPWFNDPVSDPCGEVLYLRDVDSGDVWTPTPGPAPAVGDARQSPRYTVTHGPGVDALLAYARRHRHRAHAGRSAQRRRQDRALAHHEPRRGAATTLAHQLRRMGARRRARADAASAAHALRRELRRAVRAESSSRPISRRAWRSRGSVKPSPATRHGAITSSDGTAISRRPRRCARSDSPAPRAPGTIRARRCSARSRSIRGDERRRHPARRRGERRGRARVDRAAPYTGRRGRGDSTMPSPRGTSGCR